MKLCDRSLKGRYDIGYHILTLIHQASVLSVHLGHALYVCRLHIYFLFPYQSVVIAIRAIFEKVKHKALTQEIRHY